MQFADRVQETTTTTGLGNLTLDGATTGHVTFASVLDGAQCNYLIAASDGAWEVGIGTVTASGTLSRDTVSASSTGAKLDLPVGTHTVSHVLGAASVQAIKDAARKVVRTPTPISPLTGAAGVATAPQLSANAYASIYSSLLRTERLFEVDLATGDFTTPVYTFAGDANSHDVTDFLSQYTEYKWRCRDLATDGSLSEWSEVQTFTTGESGVLEPTLTVEGAPSDVPENPTLTTSAFETSEVTDTHLNTDWQVLDSGSTVVWESLADATNKLSITMPSGVVVENTEYTFRARHRGETYGESSWSTVVATTESRFEVVPLLTIGHAQAPGITIYDQDIDTFTKLADPSDLPEPAVEGVAFSNDDTYMAVTSAETPYMLVYKRDGDTFTKLADPTNLPGGYGRGVTFSNDDTYMAVAHIGSPFITIYKRSGDTFTKLADPTDLPTGTSNYVSFSSTDTYMAVAHGTSRYITIYKRSGDTFNKLADPTSLPTGSGLGTAFSNDDTYMAVAHSVTPFVTIYKRSGDTFTKLADPTDLPANTGNGVAFSNDDTYMAVAHFTTPFITIYKRSGDTFTKLADPTDLPTNTGRGVTFSNDDTYMAVAHSGTPFVTIYKRSGDTFTKLADPTDLPTSTGYGVAFSNTGFPQ